MGVTHACLKRRYQFFGTFQDAHVAIPPHRCRRPCEIQAPAPHGCEGIRSWCAVTNVNCVVPLFFVEIKKDTNTYTREDTTTPTTTCVNLDAKVVVCASLLENPHLGYDRMW